MLIEAEEVLAEQAKQVRLRVAAGKNGKEILNEMRSAETDATTTRGTCLLSRTHSSVRSAGRPDVSNRVRPLLRLTRYKSTESALVKLPDAMISSVLPGIVLSIVKPR